MRWLLLLVVALASPVAAAQAPAPGDVVVNEILYDPPAPQPSGNEWIEVVNRSDETVDLGGLAVSDGGSVSAPVPGLLLLAPGEFAVLVRNGDAFAEAFPDVPFVDLDGFPALNNSGDRVALLLGEVEVDAVPYTSSWGGSDASLERLDPAGPSAVRANWATTTDPRGGTPGATNSQFAPDETGPQLVGASASPDGQTLVLSVDEPLDPDRVTAGAFSVSGGPAVQQAEYQAGQTEVTLMLGAALPAGESTVVAAGLADVLGNVTGQSSTTVTFVPDEVSPTLVRASALSPTIVRATFSEPVTESSATQIASYSVADGSGAFTAVAVDEEAAGGVTAVVLTAAQPFADRSLNTLVATDLEDLAGNVTASSSARFFVGTPDVPRPGDVVITEVMYDPSVGSDGEYVEVLNRTDGRIVSLQDLTLGDGSGDGSTLSDAPLFLLPGQHLALARDLDGFRVAFPDADAVEVGSAVGLSNSGEPVVLRAGGAVLDSVAYRPDWHRIELDDPAGIALERRDPAGASNAASNWSSSLAAAGGTPSAPNSLSVSDTPVEREGGLTVTSPFAPTRGEAAEITYALTAEAALVRARVFDGGGRLVRELEGGRLSGSEATLVWDGTGGDRRPLRAGIYVVLVEAVDAQGGTTEAHQAAVVLARPE